MYIILVSPFNGEKIIKDELSNVKRFTILTGMYKYNIYIQKGTITLMQKQISDGPYFFIILLIS